MQRLVPSKFQCGCLKKLIVDMEVEKLLHVGSQSKMMITIFDIKYPKSGKRPHKKVVEMPGIISQNVKVGAAGIQWTKVRY